MEKKTCAELLAAKAKRSAPSNREIVWDKMAFAVKDFLTMEESLLFVDMACSACFDSTDHSYRPELKDFLIKYATLQFYTDLPLPDDINDKHNLIYGTTLYDSVVKCIKRDFYASLLAAIEEKINTMLYQNSETLRQKVQDIVSGFDAMNSSLKELTGDIDPGFFTQLASTFHNGSIDEAKLVSAIVAQGRAEDV